MKNISRSVTRFSFILYQCRKVCSFSPWYWYLTYDEVSSSLIMTKLKNLSDRLTEASWSSAKMSKILHMGCNIPMQAGHQLGRKQLCGAGPRVLADRKLNLNKQCTLAAMEANCMLCFRKINRSREIIISISATFVVTSDCTVDVKELQWKGVIKSLCISKTKQAQSYSITISLGLQINL